MTTVVGLPPDAAPSASHVRATAFRHSRQICDPGRDEVVALIKMNDGEMEDPKAADDGVRGLTGLVMLGNAWESVDVFHALSVALKHDTLRFTRDRNGGRNSLAYLAWLRCRELIDAGKSSMLPDAPKGAAVKDRLPRPDFVEGDGFLDPAFATLRAEADGWQKARTNFMLERLNEGRHPDTDLEFWNGYVESPAPGLPTKSVPEYHHDRMEMRQRLSMLVLAGVPAATLAFVVGMHDALRAAQGASRR